VKPANVLLRPDGRPVLTDFGIATIRDSTALTATGSIIGTPDYMAPERISGGEGDPGSDLWSLAMMLYVAVEGHHPLRRGTTLATLAAMLSEQLPPPARAGVLTGFLNAVLVKNPADRVDAKTADRLLAEAIEGGGTGRSAPAGADGATSYRLAPPPGTAPTPSAPAGFGPPSGFGPAPDLGPPSGFGPASGFGPPTPYPAGPTRPTPARPPGGRAKRRAAIASSVVGTVLAGVLVWTQLPDGGDKDSGKPTGSSGAPSTRTTDPASTPSRSASTPSRSAPASQADAKTDLLTPDGIRTAVKEIKAATGTDRACDLSVYPTYVSADIMVEGSDTKYDNYTYRPGRGVEKGIISGSIIGGDRPFSLDAFDWDVLPALLKRADKDLNVKRPTLRYVLVRAADDTFDTPLGLAVYLTDDYASGYLEADLKGKVTRVMPAED
jgi:hypothetical protein